LWLARLSPKAPQKVCTNLRLSPYLGGGNPADQASSAVCSLV